MSSHATGETVRTEPRYLAWPAALAATLGAYAYSALTYNHDVRQGLAVSATIGLPAMAMVFAIAWATLRALCAVRERTTGSRTGAFSLLAIGVVAGASLTLFGIRQARLLPTLRFEALVVRPVPGSVGDIRWRRFPTFGDGDVEVLAFHVAPAELPAVLAALGVRKVPVDWDERAAEAEAARAAGDTVAESTVFPEDDLLRRCAPDLYTRPARAHFFTGDQVKLVTDEAGQRVWVLFDKMIDPTTRGGG